MLYVYAYASNYNLYYRFENSLILWLIFQVYPPRHRAVTMFSGS